jgi:Ca2+-binding RTX toxin-like protein
MATGARYYDADGNKPGGVAGVQFATLTNLDLVII